MGPAVVSSGVRSAHREMSSERRLQISWMCSIDECTQGGDGQGRRSVGPPAAPAVARPAGVTPTVASAPVLPDDKKNQ